MIPVKKITTINPTIIYLLTGLSKLTNSQTVFSVHKTKQSAEHQRFALLDFGFADEIKIERTQLEE